MAKVKIQGNASGTGILTVTAPNTSTDRTITLPDGDVTLGAATPSIDDNGNATAITIDSDENVLIGKTTYVGGSAVTGIDIRPVGMVNIAREGDTLMYMNRKTSDGDILEFRKDGASIGSIGVDGGDNLYITGESGNTGGIYINDAAVSPAYQGAERDDYYSLGKAPARWKDLYLSGGLKVGGTAAANTLDDYEEGTFTPVFKDTSNVTVTGSVYNASYTKIGQMVFISVYYSPSNVQNGYISNMSLPFTASGNQHRSAGSLWTYNGPIAEKSNQWLVQTNTSHASFWKLRDNLTSTTMQWDNGTEIVLSIAYFTSQ